MKKNSILAVLTAFVISLFGVNNVLAVSRVRSYTTKNGTYVQSYYRSSPNSTRYDNYSTKGNYNPFTGKAGYANPYKTYKFR